MKARKLRNYGKSMLEMMAKMSEEANRKADEAGARIIEKHIESDNLFRFQSLREAEMERMKKILPTFSETMGLESPDLILQQLDWAASFSSAGMVAGEEIASNAFREIVEVLYPPMFRAMLPSHRELGRCADPFIAFSDWFLAYMSANRDAGLFRFELIRKDSRVFRFSCDWCAWHAIHERLGTPKACEPICYADLEFFPAYCSKFGATFERPTSLAWGGDCCEFVFSLDG